MYTHDRTRRSRVRMGSHTCSGREVRKKSARGISFIMNARGDRVRARVIEYYPRRISDGRTEIVRGKTRRWSLPRERVSRYNNCTYTCVRTRYTRVSYVPRGGRRRKVETIRPATATVHTCVTEARVYKYNMEIARRNASSGGDAREDDHVKPAAREAKNDVCPLLV